MDAVVKQLIKSNTSVIIFVSGTIMATGLK